MKTKLAVGCGPAENERGKSLMKSNRGRSGSIRKIKRMVFSVAGRQISLRVEDSSAILAAQAKFKTVCMLTASHGF